MRGDNHLIAGCLVGYLSVCLSVCVGWLDDDGLCVLIVFISIYHEQSEDVIDKGMQDMSSKFSKVGEVYVDKTGLEKALSGSRSE